MKISEYCYALTGLCDVPPWAANAGLVAGRTKTLIIDTGINLLSAQTIFGYATAVQPENELVVINTERHFDHIGGNGFFRDRQIDIFGHVGINRTEDALTSNAADYNACITNPVRQAAFEAHTFFTETVVTNPNQPISQDMTFDLGQLEVQVLLTPGHTPTNLSVFVPAERVLFCSDCLVNGFIPNLEDGTPDDWQAWLDSLDKLEALAPTLVVPGHGQFFRGDAIAAEFERTRQVLLAAIEAGQAPTAIQPS